MNKANNESATDASQATPGPEQVAEFLKSNPTFFEGRDDLLLELVIPHQRGSSVSLVERQVTLLRENSIAMRHKLNELVSTAKSNDVIYKRTRDLILALLDATTATQLLETLEGSLKKDFKCNSCRMIVFGTDSREVNHWVSIVPPSALTQHIPGLVENHKPVLGVLRPEEQDYIFGSDSKKVKSVAMLPIRGAGFQALLAIGNKDPDYFQPRMGTLFLSFITAVLGRLIPPRMDLQ